MNTHYQVIIVGGGSAGITVAAHLKKLNKKVEIGIIDPAQKHYYQPLWTLVGAGVFEKSKTARNQSDCIPTGCQWIQDYVTSFDPDNNALTLKNGTTITYDCLIVAAGIQIDWDKIPGLKESVGKVGTGVVSNYSIDTVESTWREIKNLRSGNAIFTHPATPIKCGGAPMKIMFLAEDHWKKEGVNQAINITFVKGGGRIFAVDKYERTLKDVFTRKQITAQLNTHLVALRPDKKEAVFEPVGGGEQTVLSYEMIHVTPPMSSPDFIKNSPLAAESGWVEVDKYTTQHTRYNNVFALGDCSNLPTSKTGAAIRKQAPTTAYNVHKLITGSNLPSKQYDGYTSCPIVTGYKSLILAEFNYDKKPQESFPIDQSKERYSMYLLKAYGLPQLYWNGMLKGRA